MSDRFISSVKRHRKRWPWIAAGIALLLAGGAVAVYFAFVQKQSNYNNPNAAFQTQPSTPPKKKKARPKPETFKWPIYGYTRQRTRFLDANLHPPFRILWRFTKGKGLVEFQPILVNGVLYFVRNEGQAYAVRAKNGKMLWRRKVSSLAASSPAWDKGRIYITTLVPGSITALNAKNGKRLWRKALPSRAESSPIVVNGIVYFGSENGTVYALRAFSGKTVWTYHAGGAVKAALAYNQGRLYFGDYSGAVTALRAKTGSKAWSTATNGASFNRSGQFYSTPAVAFGRIYLGNTDSFVYSFVESNGQLAWRHGTGSYVYAAPAVGMVPGVGATVYIGSYDGNFYALNARTGGVRWTHRDGGKISGAPTVIGRVVYYSSLGNHDTLGLNVATGNRVWRYPFGAFNPVISDGQRVYLTLNSNVVGLLPKPKAKKKPQARKKPQAKKRPAPRKKQQPKRKKK
jgi:outer membrane protein assembly factor BamB